MQKSKISARCKRLLKKLFYKNKNNKKKFRLFGIPLCSLKKQPGKKVFKILGLKFSFKDKVDKWEVNQWLRIAKKGKYCPYCKKKSLFRDAGNSPRHNALCPNCGSLERTRFLYFVYNKLFLHKKQKLNILHMAPDPSVYSLLHSRKNINYTSMDLAPENYPFAIGCEKQDAMNMTYADKTFDVILANHVIEHVPNDKLYLKECLRCLKDDGMIIISFPRNNHVENFEDPSITTEEGRIKAYGQRDHVRLYGYNFMEKLSDKSYQIDVLNELDFVDNKMIKKMSLKSYNEFFGDTYLIIRKNP